MTKIYNTQDIDTPIHCLLGGHQQSRRETGFQLETKFRGCIITQENLHIGRSDHSEL
jgi:hypothetical protein